jgi:hypothetical protein
MLTAAAFGVMLTIGPLDVSDSFSEPAGDAPGSTKMV